MKYFDVLSKQNKQVQDRINRIAQQLEGVDSLEAILNIYQKESGLLHFKVWPYHVRALLFISVPLCLLYIYTTMILGTPFEDNLAIYVMLVCLIVVFGGWFGYQGKPDTEQLDRLLEVTQKKWLSLKHHIVFNQMSPEFENSLKQDDQTWATSINTFDELHGLYPNFFSLGNYSNQLTKCISGCLSMNVPYLIYEYEYVDEETDTYIDSDGDVNIRTDYVTYHDYGVFLYGLSHEQIDIHRGSGHYYPVRWEPSSLTFRETFTVSGTSEQALASFLQPRVVLSLHSFLDELDSNRMTFDQHGYTLMDVSSELFERKNEFTTSQIETTQDVIKLLPHLSLPYLASWTVYVEKYLNHYFNNRS